MVMVKRDAVGQRDRALREPADADLGALQVDEDADRVSAVVAGRAHVAVDRLVVGVGAVREVEPGDVHAGVDELRAAVSGERDGRAQGADDLGAAHDTDSSWRRRHGVTRPARAGSRLTP